MGKPAEVETTGGEMEAGLPEWGSRIWKAAVRRH